MERSKKLTRQMARYLGSETAENDFAKLFSVLQQLKSDLLPSHVLKMLENITPFLDIIDASYKKYEENITVAERSLDLSSKELMQANRSISTMVNCLGQGFLMFGQDLICAPVYSRACENLFETVPAGKSILSVLRLSGDTKSKVTSLLNQAFKGTHAMTFEEIIRFAPHNFSHSHGRSVELAYKAERDATGQLQSIVVIATDVTEKVAAETLAEERKVSFELIERALKDRASFGSFVRHVRDLLKTLLDRDKAGDLFLLQREIHTLKAGAGAFRLMRLMNCLHDFESAIKFAGKKHEDIPLSQAMLQYNAEVLQQEMTVIENNFQNLLGLDIYELETHRAEDGAALLGFAHYLAEKGYTDLRREYIRSVCTESLTTYLKHYDLYINDLAQRFNKKVKPIVFLGKDIPILRDPYKAFLESLIHIFRNIMDHGIEAPDDRRRVGKDEYGIISVEMALLQGSDKQENILLSIKDDGCGMNVGLIRAKLIVVDPEGAWLQQSDTAVVQSIFAHRISTRDVVSQYSGRGIGLNTVGEEVRKLAGSIHATTEAGKGTVVTIKIPYILDL